MNFKKGSRFYHSRVLDSMKFDGHSPQLFVITKIAKGVVYYRPVYNYGDREELGSAAWSYLNAFLPIVLKLEE